MKVLVTGATGFIGRHLIPELLQAEHAVTVIIRDVERVKQFLWSEHVGLIVADIHKLEDCWLRQIGEQDALMHLAWPDLPNYQELVHVEKNLPADYAFLKKIVEQGVEQILVTGTCFEYGNQSGVLNENSPTMPNNPYALAKDSLRKYLQALQQDYPFVLQWARLFYMYGEGQNSNSLLAQLNDAISSEKSIFNMSGGEQLRDYLPVDIVAKYLLGLVECQDCNGVVNVCSGQPISVRRLVERYLEQRNVKIILNLGYYPYADYEPMAFWGDQQKLQNLLKRNNSVEN